MATTPTTGTVGKVTWGYLRALGARPSPCQVCADEEAMKAAPSRAAKAMLQVCRADPEMLNTFFQQFFPGDKAGSEI